MTARSKSPSIIRLIAALALIASLGGCAKPPCGPGAGSPLQVFTLFFGKSIPARAELTDMEWLTFLDTTITANLPNGYTVFDANGGWMNPITHRTIKEATKVLLVALPDAPESLVPINRIRAAYQLQFHQQSVGMTVDHACGSF